MNLRNFIWNTPLLSDQKRIEYLPFFWLMRIEVLELSPDWRSIKIRLPQSWIATNIGGGMFGGFQACLADPIAAMACKHLFPDYIVLTSSLQLDFKKQGLTDLNLVFHMPPETEQKIKADLAKKDRSNPSFEYGFYQEDGSLCTIITAKIAIRPPRITYYQD